MIYYLGIYISIGLVVTMCLVILASVIYGDGYNSDDFFPQKSIVTTLAWPVFLTVSMGGIVGLIISKLVHKGVKK